MVRLPYVVGDRQVTFGIEAPSRPSTITRSYAEYTLAAVFLRLRIATGLRYPLVKVEFCHPQPANVSEHSRIFECPVSFSAVRCRLVIAREVWDMPRAGADATLFLVLDAHARMLLDQLPPDDLAGHVRGAIQGELRGGNPKLESIARVRDSFGVGAQF